MALTNAEKQARFRERRDAELEALRVQGQALLDELATACELGRCPALTNNLPEDTWAAMAELVERLRNRRLIVVQREGTRDSAEGKTGPAPGEGPKGDTSQTRRR
jgi:hypothetical protein